MSLEKHTIRGLIERYILGMMNEQDAAEFEQKIEESPEIQEEMKSFYEEVDYFIRPGISKLPNGLWDNISNRLKKKYTVLTDRSDFSSPRTSEYITIHKSWRCVFLTLIILVGIVLSLAIYFFIKYNNSQIELKKNKEHAYQNVSMKIIKIK